MKLSKEFRVGLFAIATIAMFYLGFNYLKGVEFFSRTNRYYVVYKDVGGLTKSNPVNISGFNVGRVAEIKLMQREGNVVLVGLDIDRSIVLGDSAVATLDANFLGDVSIVISVGDISRPLQPDDTLYSRVDPGLTEMLVESAQPLTDNLPATIANFNEIMEKLKGTVDTLNMTLYSVKKTSDRINYTMANNQADLTETIKNFKSISSEVNETVKGLKPLLDNLNVVTDSLKDVNFAQTLEKLNALLDQLTDASEALNNKDSSLGKLMNEDSLYNNLNKTLFDLDSLLININNSPKHFFGPLGKSSKKIEKDRAKQQQQQ